MDLDPTTPITAGNLYAALHAAERELLRELTAHRALAADLRDWFAANPNISAQFGAFQATRRATVAAPAAPARAATPRRTKRKRQSR